MAQALREGGLYKVGDRFVDAEGKEAKAPSKSEVAGSVSKPQSAPATDDAPDFESMSKEELVKLAEERGLEVTRADGEDGAPLKSDFVKALQG